MRLPLLPVGSELNVRPAGEVRVASVGEHALVLRALDPDVVLRRPGQVEIGSRDVVLTVLLDPRMIERGVVGHEIQHEPESPRLQTRAQAGEGGVAAQGGSTA